jgi:putative ubiquitin-RnfH superfamily antitoxin RatB of RatAB toxin-antitoxin module
MSLWFRKTSGLSSKVMRKAASNANLSSDYHSIQYKSNGIGYKNSKSSDATEIKDELEKLLGYRPVLIDEPTVHTNQTDQTQ